MKTVRRLATAAKAVVGRVRVKETQRARRRPELTWLLWWLVTGLFALVLLPLNIALPSEQFDVPPLVAFLAGIGQSTALVLVLVRPGAATALQFLSVAVIAVALGPDSGSTWPLTVTGIITLITHIGLIAARYPRRPALTVWWAGVLLVPLLVLVDPRGRPVTDGMGVMILFPIFSVIVLGAVLLNRRFREVRQELASARHDVEVEQSQRAVAEERTRIARELHDVVAHGMSVIHMQATSASYRIEGLSPDAKAEFARIATGARAAMHEMRQLLAVLRDENADADLAPVPGLGRLPELVESAERAGVPVEIRQADDIALPDSVGLATYRIVQESLSNVIRHAPGARTTINLDLDGEELLLVVENDETTESAPRMETPGEAGHGLRGMSERARLVGGSLETGARDEGGYRVVARLPMGGGE